MPQYLDPARIGLRSYDIALGFRNLDERSAAVAEFGKTEITGMASVLAGAVKGREIIHDGRALKRIAAEVLKINHFAFDAVIHELEELELIANVQRAGGDVTSFTESIPLVHDDTHKLLGERWANKQPTELEQQLVVAVDSLAAAPLPATDLRSNIALDSRSEHILRRVSEGAELIRYYTLRDGTEIAASPLYAFERPDQLVSLFEHHETDKLRDAFARIRQQPGVPVMMDGTDSIIEEMVQLGLVPAPTVKGADGRDRAFVILPYGLDATYLTSKKQVLERALALIAVVRCGEVSGGMTRIIMPDRYLAALVDPSRQYRLSPHSSTERQYAALIRMGVVRAVLTGNMYAAQLIPTFDNIEAVELARILLKRRGVALPERRNEQQAAELLFTGGDYLAPIETVSLARRVGPPLLRSEVEELWGRAAGWNL